MLKTTVSYGNNYETIVSLQGSSISVSGTSFSKLVTIVGKAGPPGPSDADTCPWTGITGKPDTYPPSTHNHNDLYYTETESDALFADTDHSHTEDDITNLDKYGKVTAPTTDNFPSFGDGNVLVDSGYGPSDFSGSGAVDTHESSYDHTQLHDHTNKATLDLISEAFTTTLKTKLDGIDEEANNYTHPAAHIISEVTGLQTALDGLQTALDGKEPVITKGTAFNKDFGTNADDVCEGNDSRLSDARTPTAHALDGAEHTGITGVADNFMGIDASGKPKDSGSKAGDFAVAGHNHEALYAALGHNHDATYALLAHDHDSRYSLLEHGHDTDYLNKANTTAFSPTGDYHPATKKYVDDSEARIKGVEVDDTNKADGKALVYSSTSGKIEYADAGVSFAQAKKLAIIFG